MSEATWLKGDEAEADAIREFLKAHPEFVRNDPDLLQDLGLRIDAANVVEFGPAALTRVVEAHKREAGARKQLEATARANFAAQAQTHAAVIDILEARNQADLARRVDELATLRFGLVSAVIAVEGSAPAGWYPLIEGQVDLIMGATRLALMGFHAPALGLFGERGDTIRSIAMVRMAIWEPARQGILAFGSPEPKGFTADMGAELVAFLARVVERTAERWPVL